MANKTGPKPRIDARRNPINVRIDDQTLAELQRLAAVTAQTVGTLAAQILASGVARRPAPPTMASEVARLMPIMQDFGATLVAAIAQSGDSAAQSAQTPKDAPPCRISSASLTDSVCATLGGSSSEAE